MTALQTLPGVQKILAIASGKGGVGKSTTSVNLALALAHQGHRVGLLDADIYGPNQPHMLGVSEAQPEIIEQNGKQKLRPVVSFGLQSMSIAYLVDPKTPMVWRAPMVIGALQQLIYDTLWDNLDYLLIDLPPGTGDIQLSLAQKLPLAGVVMVTTPQDVALLDVRKGIVMFEKVHVPILGVVENMSFHECSHCGSHEEIFGRGGAEKIAQEFNTELLGKIPLLRTIQEECDQGTPSVAANSASTASKAYLEIADKISRLLDQEEKKTKTVFPKIVIADK